MDKTDLPAGDAERVCGKCKWAKPADEAHIACFGGIPVPVLMGVAQDQWRRPQPQFMNMRPVLSLTEPACRVFEKGSALVLIGTKQ